MTIKKRRNRFRLCGSGSDGTISTGDSSSSSSTSSSTSSGHVRIRLGFSTRLRIFFRRILSRFRKGKKRIHPNRQSSMSVTENRSLSIIMELPEHTEPSGTQIAPSPRPFSAGVQKIIHRLNVKQSLSCSSRDSSQSPEPENENMSPTAAKSSSQYSSISNMFDIASLSSELLEETIVDHQINHQYEEKVESANMDVSRGYCRNENAKEREQSSLMSSTANSVSPMDSFLEKTGDTETMKMENKTEIKSVQFQTNVRVYPSPGGRVDTSSQEMVQSLSDHPLEGLQVGDDCKSRRPATPGNIFIEGETPVSLSHIPIPGKDGKKTISPHQASTMVTSEDPNDMPSNAMNPDNDKWKTGVPLPECSANNQHTNILVEWEHCTKQEDNSSALDNDTLSDNVCAKQSFNVVDSDRQELEKARRRADRKKRKEMRMAAEGYNKEPENLPQGEGHKKRSKKKERPQKDSAVSNINQTLPQDYGKQEEFLYRPDGPQEYRQQAIIRLQAERDLTNPPTHEGSESVVIYEDKLQSWEKMKRNGDIHSLDCQEGTNSSTKTQTKKKKKRNPAAARDDVTEKTNMKQKILIEDEVKNEDCVKSGEVIGKYSVPINQSVHHRDTSNRSHESKSTNDNVLDCSNDNENPDYYESHLKLGETASTYLDEVSNEQLSQEEQRKKKADRKKRKETKAAAKKLSNDEVLFVTPEDEAVKDYPNVQDRSSHRSRKLRNDLPNEDKMSETQLDIEKILALSSYSEKMQQTQQVKMMPGKEKSVKATSLNSGYRQGSEMTETGTAMDKVVKSEDSEAFKIEEGYQKDSSNSKPKKKMMNVSCVERIQQQNFKQKRDDKNFEVDKLNSAVSPVAETPYDGDALTAESDILKHQRVINEDDLDLNPIRLASGSETDSAIPSESSKKYVDAGVGPTPSENVSQKSVFESKTMPVNVTGGEQHRKTSNKNTEQQYISSEKYSKNQNGSKQSGGHLIGQQYSVDQHLSLCQEEDSDGPEVKCREVLDVGDADMLCQVPMNTPTNLSRMLNKVQTLESRLMMADQDDSMSWQGVRGNDDYHEDNLVINKPSKYPRNRDSRQPENDKDRQWTTSPSVRDDLYPSAIDQDRPRPVGCDVDISQGKELETTIKRKHQSGTNRPESRSLWSTSNMSIPHSIQEEDETAESDELDGQAEQDYGDSALTEDNKDRNFYVDTGQENSIKYPVPGPREELAPNVFKVDKMNLPPVCNVQKENLTTSSSARIPYHSNLTSGVDKELDSGTENIMPLGKQRKVDAIQNRTSPELDGLLNDIKAEVEMRLIPDQTWEEVTWPKGHFRPKVKATVDQAKSVQGQDASPPSVGNEQSTTNSTAKMMLANLSRKQRAHYEKLQVTFRAPEKNLPGAQFWKELNADKLVPEAVSEDLFIKTPFGNIFPNASEDQLMSPIKAYCDERSHRSDVTFDETGYESMEQSEMLENNSPESLSDLRDKLRQICRAEVDSDQTQHHHSPPTESDMNEVSTDPRFWQSTDTPNQYEDTQTFKEPSYAPSLTDRYHIKKEENLDFFRCVSRATQNNSQVLRTEEENIARSFARTQSEEHTLDAETADGNLLFFKTVAKCPEFYEEAETTDLNVVKSKYGRSPGYIPDDPSNYVSREVAHQNLEFFRSVARDTSFFHLPQKNDKDSEEDTDEEETSPRDKLVSSPNPPIQHNDTSGPSKDRPHHHAKMRTQQSSSETSHRIRFQSVAQGNLGHFQQSSPPKPQSKWFNRNDALSLVQPVVSPSKAKENMDFFLQVSKDPHFYKIAEKPEAPIMVAPDVKPKHYKTYNGINVNSGRPIGKQGLGFKSRHTS
ncbi:uncharacterized protein LOC132544670 [Ylistrum balloti]|uniref:uncharacterized protein LOC132544670 n=1 Tax=Ylistrum balloti TaxID=509963 RepID=UPI002905A583|nr:uncharacterized protein LOC132544670 [Ylistrum balloti]